MQFPSEKFDGTEPGKSLDHWNLFMQYWNYVLRKGYVPGQNDANYFATFREQFVLTLSFDFEPFQCMTSCFLRSYFQTVY